MIKQISTQLISALSNMMATDRETRTRGVVCSTNHQWTAQIEARQSNKEGNIHIGTQAAQWNGLIMSWMWAKILQTGGTWVVENSKTMWLPAQHRTVWNHNQLNGRPQIIPTQYVHDKLHTLTIVYSIALFLRHVVRTDASSTVTPGKTQILTATVVDWAGGSP